jgi:hypothetical protein
MKVKSRKVNRHSVGAKAAVYATLATMFVLSLLTSVIRGWWWPCVVVAHLFVLVGAVSVHKALKDIFQ